MSGLPEFEGGFTIAPIVDFSDRELNELSDTLIDCVEGGASVGFIAPMTRAKADAFWRSAAGSARRGERIVIVAKTEGQIRGTVSVIWATAENQSHRADIAKMLVHRTARRRGLGARLLKDAESVARSAGRTMLVLDTATECDAYRLYRRQGWQRCGEIPDYALWPDGRFCATTVFYKALSGKEM